MGILSKTTVGVVSGVAGMAVGIAATAAVAKWLHDSAMEDEKRLRNVIPADELTSEWRDKKFNIVTQYEQVITQLVKAVQASFGESEATQLGNMLKDYALPKQEGDKQVFVPALDYGLLKAADKGDGSGVNNVLFTLFGDYKVEKDRKMDIYIAMMQILENILIIYKQFLEDNIKIPGDEQTKRIKDVQSAMVNIVNDLKNNTMFQKRGSSLAWWETKREITLPKIFDMMVDMGNEAVQIQQDLTKIEQSKEKEANIRRLFVNSAEFIERTSEADIYHMSRAQAYNIYTRKDGIINYSVTSRDNRASDPNELIPHITQKHMSSVYTTFFSDKIQVDRGADFSYFNYLVNVTNANHDDDKAYKDEKWEAKLPRIAEITTDTYNQPLKPESVLALAPNVDRYFKYLTMAAAMQADLTKRLDAFGWVGLSRSGEFEYRRQLIDVFIQRAQEIAQDEILKENSYFRQFMQRTNDASFIKKAITEDGSTGERLLAWGTSNPILSDADKSNDIHTNVIFADKNHYKIPLSNMANAQALNAASLNLNKINEIDKEWNKIESAAVAMAGKEGLGSVKQKTMDHEFLYNVALACQGDKILQENLKKIKAAGAGKDPNQEVLSNYIDKMNEIKLKFNGSMSFNINSDEEKIIIAGGKKFPMTSEAADSIETFLSTFHPSLFVFGENGKVSFVIPNFQNKKMVSEFAKSLSQLHHNLTTVLPASGGVNIQEGSFIDYLGKQALQLADQFKALNRGIDVTPLEFERIEREQQKAKFEQMISEMQERHKVMTESLAKGVESYKVSQQHIIDNLFNSNVQTLTDLTKKITAQTADYEGVLKGQSGELEEAVNNSFSEVNKSVESILEKQKKLYEGIGVTLSATDKSLENSNNVIAINQQLYDEVGSMMTLLQEEMPKIIDSIFLKVTQDMQQMSNKYEAKNTKLQEEVKVLEGSKEKLEAENQGAKENIQRLETSNLRLNVELTSIQDKLSAQEGKITEVGRGLKGLLDLAKRLSDISQDNDYIAAKNAVSKGASDIGSISSKSDFADIESKLGGISNNFHKASAIIDTAEKLSKEIESKIHEVIALNNSVLGLNTEVKQHVETMNTELEAQKKEIEGLKKTIETLQIQLSTARNAQIESLRTRINENEKSQATIRELMTTMEKEKREQISELKAKAEKSEEKIEDLSEQNKKYIQDHANIQRENEENKRAMQAAQKDLTLASQQHQQEIEASKQHLIMATKKVIDKTLQQFNGIAQAITTACDQSEVALKNNQSQCESELKSINEKLDSIKQDILKLDQVLQKPDAVIHAPQAADASPNDNSMASLEKLCKNVGAIVLINNEDRLKNTKKLNWLKAANTELQLERDPADPAAVIEAFKVLLIISLQNKNGSGLLRSKKTKTGSLLVLGLNTSGNEQIRKDIFGSSDSLTYEQLAGVLQKDTNAVAKARTQMSLTNNEPLTISEFKGKDITPPYFAKIEKEKIEQLHAQKIQALKDETRQSVEDARKRLVNQQNSLDAEKKRNADQQSALVDASKNQPNFEIKKLVSEIHDTLLKIKGVINSISQVETHAHSNQKNLDEHADKLDAILTKFNEINNHIKKPDANSNKIISDLNRVKDDAENLLGLVEKNSPAHQGGLFDQHPEHLSTRKKEGAPSLDDENPTTPQNL